MKCGSARIAIFLFAYFGLAVGSATAQDQRPVAGPTSAPFAGATISDWKGKIQLNLPGQSPSAPARNETLPAGSVLQTESGRMLLRLSDGSQILIGPHTRLLVQQPVPSDRNYFQILFGRIRAFVSKQTGGSGPFELGTPSAVIAVRGTEFEIEVNRLHVTEVDVYEGLVEVSGRGGIGRSVLLEPGFSTRVGIDGFPEEPKPTNEIRPEVERPQREEKDLRDVKNLGEIADRREMDRESKIEQELEKEVATEISGMMERQEVSEQPEVQIEVTTGPEPN
jgi:hypothetical protein